MLDYLTSGVNDGEVYFAATSLHDATLGGPSTYPSFYLDADGFSLGATATLELTISAAFDPADTDQDGDVDTVDITTMFQNFTGAVGGAGGKTWTAMSDGDTDADGDVDTADITLGYQHFTGAQNAGLPSASPVPEPSSWVLLALGVLGGWGFTRRSGRRATSVA